MTQIIEDEKKVETFLPKKSCYYCVGIRICYYFRAEQQVLAIPENLNPTEKQIAEQSLPFTPDQVAEICKYYKRAT